MQFMANAALSPVDPQKHEYAEYIDSFATKTARSPISSPRKPSIMSVSSTRRSSKPQIHTQPRLSQTSTQPSSVGSPISSTTRTRLQFPSETTEDGFEGAATGQKRHRMHDTEKTSDTKDDEGFYENGTSSSLKSTSPKPPAKPKTSTTLSGAFPTSSSFTQGVGVGTPSHKAKQISQTMKTPSFASSPRAHATSTTTRPAPLSLPTSLQPSSTTTSTTTPSSTRIRSRTYVPRTSTTSLPSPSQSQAQPSTTTSTVRSSLPHSPHASFAPPSKIRTSLTQPLQPTETHTPKAQHWPPPTDPAPPPPPTAAPPPPPSTSTTKTSSSKIGTVLPSPTVASTTGTNSRAPSTHSTSLVSTSGSSSSSRKERKPTKQPMTPAEVMKKYAMKLTAFEQSEILEYHHIYFVGESAQKIKGIPHTANNNGYDDERGDYKVMMHDHLEYRYEVLGVLGRGSFGQVLQVLDHKKDMLLALKIIRNKKRFHHQALVEVKILEHLMSGDKEHKSNIVRVYGYFYFRNHLCITFESLSINLYEFIKNNNFKGVGLSLIRRFAVQLLQALKFLKKERIIHCDLKPENILLRYPHRPSVKLIDFGSSCFVNERIYTYIQSRFYRSPEVILGLSYDYGIDMWSLGCILSELYTGFPLFPGENETEQIQTIMEVLNIPPKKMILNSNRKKLFFDAQGKPLLVPNSRGKIRTPGSKDLATATKCNDPNFLSFLSKCLKWDPKTRIQPEKALEHPFITEGRHSTRSSSSHIRSSSTHVRRQTTTSLPPSGQPVLVPPVASTITTTTAPPTTSGPSSAPAPIVAPSQPKEKTTQHTSISRTVLPHSASLGAERLPPTMSSVTVPTSPQSTSSIHGTPRFQTQSTQTDHSVSSKISTSPEAKPVSDKTAKIKATRLLYGSLKQPKKVDKPEETTHYSYAKSTEFEDGETFEKPPAPTHPAPAPPKRHPTHGKSKSIHMTLPSSFPGIRITGGGGEGESGSGGIFPTGTKLGGLTPGSHARELRGESSRYHDFDTFSTESKTNRRSPVPPPPSSGTEVEPGFAPRGLVDYGETGEKGRKEHWSSTGGDGYRMKEKREKTTEFVSDVAQPQSWGEAKIWGSQEDFQADEDETLQLEDDDDYSTPIHSLNTHSHIRSHDDTTFEQTTAGTRLHR